MYLPDFLHAAHTASLFEAESWTPEVVESASQTGVVENASQLSATPDTSPQTLQAPVERHL